MVLADVPEQRPGVARFGLEIRVDHHHILALSQGDALPIGKSLTRILFLPVEPNPRSGR